MVVSYVRGRRAPRVTAGKPLTTKSQHGSYAMHCPFCGHPETGVLESRFHTSRLFRRRRQCHGCLKRFTTAEVVAMGLEEATAEMADALTDLRTPLTRKALRVQNLIAELLDELEKPA